jgi:hypothetical protein
MEVNSWQIRGDKRQATTIALLVQLPVNECARVQQMTCSMHVSAETAGQCVARAGCSVNR